LLVKYKTCLLNIERQRIAVIFFKPSCLMQSLLFVFIGLPKIGMVPEISILHQWLQEKYEADIIPVEFSREDELLSAKLGDVLFYISFLKNETDLEDWFQMAADFELMVASNPVSRQELLQRYEEIKTASPELYNKVHYSTALTIFDAMSGFKDISIFSFQ
jgi:hypothetical protein